MPDDHSRAVMRPPALHTTEIIRKDDGIVISRMRVPGGWMYREARHNDEGVAVALCFVPDPR